jgi:hypothetical protein
MEKRKEKKKGKEKGEESAVRLFEEDGWMDGRGGRRERSTSGGWRLAAPESSPGSYLYLLTSPSQPFLAFPQIVTTPNTIYNITSNIK